MLVRAVCTVVQILLMFSPAAAAVAAAAETGQIGISPIAWQCVQERDEAFHVLCAPRTASPDAAALVLLPTSTSATGPGAADMRPVAQRGDAEVFSASAWRVPLHSQPTDRSLVETLLKSVLCGTRPACSVDYDNAKLRVAGR